MAIATLGIRPPEVVEAVETAILDSTVRDFARLAIHSSSCWTGFSAASS
jgi:hypothetical protein